jgi:thiol-disulfide isomerase/thioredoxin
MVVAAMMTAGAGCQEHDASGGQRGATPRGGGIEQPLPEGAPCTPPQCLPKELTLVDTMDQSYPLGATAGKVVILNFWATWCGPCKNEIPALNRVYTEYKSRGVEIFGILTDNRIESDAELLNFQSDHEMTYPTVWFDATIGRHFVAPGNIPTTWIYDKQGRRVVNKVGELREDELREHLNRLLAAK